MDLLILVGAVVIVVGILLMPIKIAATFIGADNTGFGRCFLAVLVFDGENF